ncbi:cell division protein FtsA [Dehalogenimonas alkenigignens]|uniref:Cell division protein FtsA n=1 Tax=Dehalogenimonas alkenigignens TaxID=1217799 RepID=A0A0W0GJP4_9CHLR|nr:cell division protein FtsA [Dehalogenimonas alkenigignens]KTB48769.1 Cell division protein FtsA [Dehalogenimonas alkenigignens]
MKERVSAIDIGADRICTVVAEASQLGVSVLGIGVAPSRGLQKGMVVNLDEARQSIRSSLALAERSSGHRIDSAVISITGNHQHRGVIALIKEILPGLREPENQSAGQLPKGFITEIKRVPQNVHQQHIENLGVRLTERLREVAGAR